MQNVVKQAFTETSASGTELAIDNTIEARMNVSLYGNTKQDGEPTPDTPVEIQKVTGNNKVVVSNQNLFDKDNANILNGFINTATKKYQELSTAKSCYISIKPNTTYTISKISSQRFVLATFNTEIINGTPVTIIGGPKNTVTSYTITTGGNDKYLGVFYYLSTADTLSEETIRNSIQIEQGSTATDYVPHQGQTYPINLGSMELCKIGDYQDRIVKDNGKWYKYGAIGKVVLDGSETWTNDFGTNLFDIQGYFNDKPFIIGYGLSNYYKYNSVQRGINIETVNGEFALQMANLNYNIFFKNTDYSSPTDFKTWLSTHNTTVYYVLATPTTTEITDTTLINQLNEISQALSKKGTTIISQSNDDLPFNLDVIALTK